MLHLDDGLDQAIRITRSAGALLRQGWGQAGLIRHKGQVDLVTDFDRQAEALVVRALRSLYPHHHICAEEQGSLGPDGSEYTWYLDPLDGTTNFAHSFPVFAVSLALWRRQEPLLGVVFDPIRDELFTAAAGSGSRLNGARITVSKLPDLDRSLLATGFPYNRRTAQDNNVANLALFLRRCQGVRRAGAAALDLAYVACGRLDGYWEFGLQPWDMAAGTLLVQEANGQVTGFQGEPVSLAPGCQLVASNGRIHREMLEVLSTGPTVAG
jgi:myo-inositol-1(or 4)-monophosphatase